MDMLVKLYELNDDPALMENWPPRVSSSSAP